MQYFAFRWYSPDSPHTAEVDRGFKNTQEMDVFLTFSQNHFLGLLGGIISRKLINYE